MTYGEFKKKAVKSRVGAILFLLWLDGKIPLCPAMRLLEDFERQCLRKFNR